MQFIHKDLRKHLKFLLSTGERCVINGLVSFSPDPWTREYRLKAQMLEDGRVPIVYETSNSMTLTMVDARGKNIFEITILPDEFIIKEFGNKHIVHIRDISQYVPLNMTNYTDMVNTNETMDLTIDEIQKLIYLCGKLPCEK